MKWDATHSIGKKTLDDKESEQEINPLAVLWGQHGHILSFSFVDAEGTRVWQLMNHFLLERWKMLDQEQLKRNRNPYVKSIKRKVSCVEMVKAACSDCRCEGVRDPRTIGLQRCGLQPREHL